MPETAQQDGKRKTEARTNRYRAAVTFVAAAIPRLPGADEVLKPIRRMTASRSAFCTGLASAAAKSELPSTGSFPLYALTATMGVFVFLLLVVLM